MTLSVDVPASPVRYMGTKRRVAPVVRGAIQRLDSQPARVADLFSGMGSVASALAPDFPVVTNDDLAFTTLFAHARFCQYTRGSSSELALKIARGYVNAVRHLESRFADELARESDVLASRDSGQLASYMATAPHVGSSPDYRDAARDAAAASGAGQYCLVTLYFAGGYFSVNQAIRLDALRRAIDAADITQAQRRWALAAWLAGAAAVVNAPGHTAQFLKPTGDAVAARIARTWSRDVWEAFVSGLDAIGLVGTRRWRRQTRVYRRDARRLARSPLLDDVSVVYADPPYTKDHYSRFYHVYETMARYDFPGSEGAGRYRSQRLMTGFSRVTQVESEFRGLMESLSERGLSLVLSYPSDGLLARAGVEVVELVDDYFELTEHICFDLKHSTMGASSGKSQKLTEENIYVCRPR